MLPNVFYCEHCCQVFINTTGDFTEHMASHSTPKSATSFACGFCEQKFKHQSLLHSHMKVHIGQKPFQPINCPKTSDPKRKLESHTELHTECFRCTVCNKNYPTQLTLEEHKKVHIYKCNSCDKTFQTRSGLFKHCKTHSAKPYSCKHCKKAFTKQKHRDSHMQFHKNKDKTYTCDICNKEFDHIQSLNKHLRIHTNNDSDLCQRTRPKSFKCTICDKAYALQRNLEEHEKIHTEEYRQRFKCTICDKVYTLKRTYDEHMRTHSGEKPFECNDCGKTFPRFSSLYKHRKTHIKRPYMCKYCKQTFAEQKHCDIHMKFHTDGGKLAYTCDICNKDFRYASTLSQHLQVHSGERPYPCSQCKQTFPIKKRLQSHYKKKHPIEHFAEREVSPFPLETALQDHVYFQTAIDCTDEKALNDTIGSKVGYVKSRKKLDDSVTCKNIVEKPNSIVPEVNSTIQKGNHSSYTEDVVDSPTSDAEHQIYLIQDSSNHDDSNMFGKKNSTDYTRYDMVEIGNDVILVENISGQTEDANPYRGNHTDDHLTSLNNSANDVIHEKDYVDLVENYKNILSKSTENYLIQGKNGYNNNENDHVEDHIECGQVESTNAIVDQKNQVVTGANQTIVYSKDTENYSEYHENHIEDHAVRHERAVNHSKNHTYSPKHARYVETCTEYVCTDDDESCLVEEADQEVYLTDSENDTFLECYQNISNKHTSLMKSKTYSIENDSGQVAESIVHVKNHMSPKISHSNYLEEDAGHSKDQISSIVGHLIDNIEHEADNHASLMEIQTLQVKRDLKSQTVSYTDASNPQTDCNSAGNHSNHAENNKDSLIEHLYEEGNVNNLQTDSNFIEGYSRHAKDNCSPNDHTYCKEELTEYSTSSEKESVATNESKTFSCSYSSKKLSDLKSRGHLLIHMGNNNLCSCENCSGKQSIKEHSVNLEKTRFHKGDSNLSVDPADNASINNAATSRKLSQFSEGSTKAPISSDQNVNVSYHYDNLKKSSKTQGTLASNQNIYLNAILNKNQGISSINHPATRLKLSQLPKESSKTPTVSQRNVTALYLRENFKKSPKTQGTLASCQNFSLNTILNKCQVISSINNPAACLKLSQLLQASAKAPTTSDQNVTATHLHENLKKSPEAQNTLAFNQSTYLNRILIKSQGIYHCKDCNKTYRSRYGISYHQKLHEKMFTCKHCFKQFFGILNFNEHLKIHKRKRFTCQRCDKSFKQKKTLVYHSWIHSGIRPYTCKYCQKTFRQKHTLSSHMKLHTGENMHSCVYCEKKFIHKNSLIEHIRFHTGEKPFVCPQCHKAFARIWNFNLHVKRHAVIRPFTCHYCKKRFATKEKRDSHLTFHIHARRKFSEKKFPCTFCSKTFHYNKSLQNHIKIHTGKNSLSCTHCQVKFSSKRALKKHEENHLSSMRPVITVHDLNDDASENIQVMKNDEITEHSHGDALKLLLQMSEIPVTDIYIQTT